jgi:hypothetical protein
VAISYEHCNGPSGLIKSGEFINRERISASQFGLCSMDLSSEALIHPDCTLTLSVVFLFALSPGSCLTNRSTASGQD